MNEITQLNTYTVSTSTQFRLVYSGFKLLEMKSCSNRSLCWSHTAAKVTSLHFKSFINILSLLPCPFTEVSSKPYLTVVN